MNYQENLLKIVNETPISIDVETEDLHGPSFLAVASARLNGTWFKKIFNLKDEQALAEFKELYKHVDLIAHNAPYDVKCLYRDFQILPRSIAYDTCTGNQRRALAKVAEFLENGFPIYSFKTKPKKLSWEDYCSFHSQNTFLIWEQINKKAIIQKEYAVLYPYACITGEHYVKNSEYVDTLKKDLFDFVGMEFDIKSPEARAMAAMKIGLPIPGNSDKKTITQDMIKPGKNVFFDSLYQIFKIEKGSRQETSWDFYFGGEAKTPYLGLKSRNTVPPELIQGQLALWMNWPKWTRLIQLLKDDVDPSSPIVGDYRDWYAKCYLALGTSGRSLVKYFKQSPEQSWAYLAKAMQESPFKNLAKWMKSCDNGQLYKEMFGTLYQEETDKYFSLFWLNACKELFPKFQGASSWVTVFDASREDLQKFVQTTKVPILAVEKNGRDKWLYFRA